MITSSMLANRRGTPLANGHRRKVWYLSAASIAVGLLSTIVPATAGTVTGTIQWVIARSTDGLTYAAINGTASGKPACATQGYWIITDENSEAGKKQYAMLLLAEASGETVTVVGDNTCTRWSDAEDIEYIELVAN